MKSLIYIVVIFIFSSCVVESDKLEGIVRILNESNQEVKLKFYDRAGLNTLEDQILNTGEGFITPEFSIDNLDLFSSENALATGFLVADSLEIIFNNERKSIMFTMVGEGTGRFSSPFERNIFRIGNYDNIGGSDYQYTITQEDFENATPCDGPCE